MQKSKIKSIITNDIKDLRTLDENEIIPSQNEACVNMAVSLCLEDEIDISRGDILASINHDLKMSNTFEAMIIWMSQKQLDLNENYLIKELTIFAMLNLIILTIKKISILLKKKMPQI